MGKPWRDRLHNELGSRVLSFAFHSGVALLFIVTILYFWPVNSFTSSSGSPRLSAWFQRFNETAVEELGESMEKIVYVREWEVPSVRDASEHEKMGEAEYGEAPRRFIPFGIGSLTFLFSHFGSYRTGPNSFAVVGLGSKSLHSSWSKPEFRCSWTASPPAATLNNSSSDREPSRRTDGESVIHGTATKYYVPDSEFGGTTDYITLVVYCTFESPVGVEGDGGKLEMIAEHGHLPEEVGRENVEFVALVEQEGEYNASRFDAPFQYEYLYCGSPLYGSISPRRLREWLAYHMRLFGQDSYFILYDVGAINDAVWRVVEPWVKIGRVTIMNVRQQVRYDAYLYNQFLLANDCLLRAKTLAKWTFFFDIDEYLHVTEAPHLEQSFHEVMAEMSQRGRRATSVRLQQRAMSNIHCVRNDPNPTIHQREWEIEKLVYRRLVNNSGDWSHWRDYKSAIQAKYVLSMGIHWAVSIELPQGLSEEDAITHLDYYSEWCGNCVVNKLHYYHYHGTTTHDKDLCKELVDPQNTTFDFDGAMYQFDNAMSFLAADARVFELRTIGYRLS